MTGGEPVRLQKAISAAGLMSRRAAEELIGAGRVTIDGRVAVLGDRVDPVTSAVAIDGALIPVAPDLVTYLLYKPLGVISTSEDPHGRQTVVDLVPAEPRVWPVGRLDADSEGLILMTNDGTLTNLVTHPRYGVPKTYQVMFEGAPGRSALRRLAEGSISTTVPPERVPSSSSLATVRSPSWSWRCSRGATVRSGGWEMRSATRSRAW